MFLPLRLTLKTNVDESSFCFHFIRLCNVPLRRIFLFLLILCSTSRKSSLRQTFDFQEYFKVQVVPVITWQKSEKKKKKEKEREIRPGNMYIFLHANQRRHCWIERKTQQLSSLVSIRQARVISIVYVNEQKPGEEAVAWQKGRERERRKLAKWENKQDTDRRAHMYVRRYVRTGKVDPLYEGTNSRRDRASVNTDSDFHLRGFIAVHGSRLGVKSHPNNKSTIRAGTSP